MKDLQVEIKNNSVVELSINKKELIAIANEAVEPYKNIVIGADDVPSIKKVKANFRKLANSLNDKRIQAVKPLTDGAKNFKSDVDEVIAVINAEVENLDSQVKAFEGQEKEKKRKLVCFIVNNVCEHFNVPQTGIELKDSWLNKTTTAKTIKKDVEVQAYQILKDIRVRKKLEKLKLEKQSAIEGVHKNISANFSFDLSVVKYLNSDDAIDVVMKNIQQDYDAEQLRREEAARVKVAEQNKPVEPVKEKTKFNVTINKTFTVEAYTNDEAIELAYLDIEPSMFTVSQ